MSEFKLSEMDGLRFSNNSKNFPHPCQLMEWSNEGLFFIDVDQGCFRLTKKGKEQQK